MFGYIRPFIPELKVKEYEMYKAVYCGLCKSMGKNISALSKLTLSYDMVFLALVRILLTDDQISCKPFRCKLKPTKKRMLVTSNESLRFSSSVSAILVYYKCLDDIQDTKNILKRIIKYAILPFLSHMKKKAAKLYVGLEEKIFVPLKELREYEMSDSFNSQNPPSLDRLASCFGNLLSDVVSFGINEEEKDKIAVAEIIGRNTGRWLYITDALDDYDTDIKKKEYNIFSVLYKNKNEFKEDIESVKISLNLSLNEIHNAVSFFENKAITPIINNIVHLGFARVQENIMKKLQQENKSVKKKKGNI